MGQRDKGGREQKKVKKDAKKPIIGQMMEPTAEVEVIKRVKREK